MTTPARYMHRRVGQDVASSVGQLRWLKAKGRRAENFGVELVAIILTAWLAGSAVLGLVVARAGRALARTPSPPSTGHEIDLRRPLA